MKVFQLSLNVAVKTSTVLLVGCVLMDIVIIPVLSIPTLILILPLALAVTLTLTEACGTPRTRRVSRPPATGLHLLTLALTPALVPSLLPLTLGMCTTMPFCFVCEKCKLLILS